uniref:Uncharacterized protein LOC104229405 n=1 Tax=Nicotiana sylvestris TaxID=4096 RepID=A0A1U7WSR6_NICSY|nr:PREDICTED: uncharacterized protein LOC104229405 [Nicotiana sylvestris]
MTIVLLSPSFIHFLYYCCDEDNGSDQIYMFSISSFPVHVRSMFSREVTDFSSVRGSWFRFGLLFLLDNIALFSWSLDQNIVSADFSIVIKRTSNKQLLGIPCTEVIFLWSRLIKHVLLLVKIFRRLVK